MNQEATEWVWEHSRARGVARLVLLAIAGRVTGPECTAYAGTTMLVRRTGASRSAVVRAVDALTAAGELKIIPGETGPRGETRYRLPRAAEYLRALPDSHGFSGIETGGVTTLPVAERDRLSGDPRGSETTPEGSHQAAGRGSKTRPPSKREDNYQDNSSDAAREAGHVRQAAESVTVPEGARPLLVALDGAGVHVTWRLAAAEWATVLAAVQRWGTDALVRVAVERTAGRDIRSARYLLAIWRDPANLTTPAPPDVDEPGPDGGTVVPLRRAYADNLAAGLALLQQQGRAR